MSSAYEVFLVCARAPPYNLLEKRIYSSEKACSEPSFSCDMHILSSFSIDVLFAFYGCKGAFYALISDCLAASLYSNGKITYVKYQVLVLQRYTNSIIFYHDMSHFYT